MKATVNKVMMSLMLAACLLSTQAVSAQGRSGARGTMGGSRSNTTATARTSSNDSRQATVSRSAAPQTRSAQQQAVRQSSSVDRSVSQVGTRSSGSAVTRQATSMPRSTGSAVTRDVRPNTDRVSTRQTTSRPVVTHDNSSTTRSDRSVATGRATMSTDRSTTRSLDTNRGTRSMTAGGQVGTGNTDKGNRGGNHNGTGGNVRPGDDKSHNNGGGTVGTRGGNHNGDRTGTGGNVRPSDDKGHNGTGGNYARGGTRPGDNKGNHGGNVGTRGTDVKPRVNHNPPRPPKPYHGGPAAHRDQYRWNYMHSNWSRPLPPPSRAYRPLPLRYYRPVVPVHYRPLVGAPIIDRILGITFGTYMDVSLSHLYYNGYDIDGYDNGIVYLRNVGMLNLTWHDVMLNYDDYGRLVNAQFVYSQSYRDYSRYDRVYRDLCAVYGSPIAVNDNAFESAATWFGGNSTGYVTLSFGYQAGRYYTTLSVGN